MIGPVLLSAVNQLPVGGVAWLGATVIVSEGEKPNPDLAETGITLLRLVCRPHSATSERAAFATWAPAMNTPNPDSDGSLATDS